VQIKKNINFKILIINMFTNLLGIGLDLTYETTKLVVKSSVWIGSAMYSYGYGYYYYYRKKQPDNEIEIADLKLDKLIKQNQELINLNSKLVKQLTDVTTGKIIKTNLD
jgi:hypothetical protein